MIDGARVELAERLRTRFDELARGIVGRYRDEIVDYAAADPDFLDREVLTVTRTGLRQVLDSIAAGAIQPSDAQIDELQLLLARRPHQGVALPSVQHAFRLFGEHLYDELAACASADRPDQLQAAIEGGRTIMRFTHVIIGVVTQTYLDELEDVRGDREIVSRSLLDAVLAGRSSSPSARRDARILGLRLVPQNVVVVARAPTGEEQRPRTLRAVAKALREQLHQHLDGRRALIGVRENEVVCVCPAPSPRHARQIHAAAHAAAGTPEALGLSIGVGHWHALAEEVPAAYAEAREAADVAVRNGVSDRAVVYDDVLVDHVLRSSENAGRVVAAALAPLQEYDELRQAGLVETLRAYIDSNFSITRAARSLHVHNNTVLYRFGRIVELTGRDPRDPRDVVFFALSLRMR